MTKKKIFQFKIVGKKIRVNCVIFFYLCLALSSLIFSHPVGRCSSSISGTSSSSDLSPWSSFGKSFGWFSFSGFFNQFGVLKLQKMTSLIIFRNSECTLSTKSLPWTSFLLSSHFEDSSRHDLSRKMWSFYAFSRKIPLFNSNLLFQTFLSQIFRRFDDIWHHFEFFRKCHVVFTEKPRRPLLFGFPFSFSAFWRKIPLLAKFTRAVLFVLGVLTEFRAKNLIHVKIKLFAVPECSSSVFSRKILAKYVVFLEFQDKKFTAISVFT